MNTPFSKYLRSERKRLVLTQAEAAALLAVSVRTYWDWEDGKTEPLQVAQEGIRARFADAIKLPTGLRFF